MADGTELKRMAYSPREFSELFGKSRIWGYRQIYAGKVKAITAHGRTLIPASEVDAILHTAGIFDGAKPKKVKTKSEIQELAPQLPNAWKAFLAARRLSSQPKNQPNPSAAAKKWPSAPSERRAALARLSQLKK